MGQILRNRPLSVAFLLLGLVQVTAALMKFRTFECPMLVSTGFPCPGCGLSRACGAFLRADWHAWRTLHLFAPVFLLGIVLILAGLVLPARSRLVLIEKVEAVERHTGAAAFIVAGIFVYWLLRSLYAPGEFIVAVR